MTKSTRRNRQRFVLSSLFFILFLCVLASINEVRFHSLLKFGRSALANIPSRFHNSSSTNFLIAASSSSCGDDIRVLVGILTLPDQYCRRHFLRLICGTQSPAGAQVDVKFSLCNLKKEGQKVLVALEIMRYDDIVILHCKENMNKGKTYVMKADDDAYFRLDNLVQSLKPLPREDLYYGYVIPYPRMNPFVNYMSGMGYLCSGLETRRFPGNIWKGLKTKSLASGSEKVTAPR